MRGDIDPQILNHKTDITDVGRALNAFLGLQYSFNIRSCSSSGEIALSSSSDDLGITIKTEQEAIKKVLDYLGIKDNIENYKSELILYENVPELRWKVIVNSKEYFVTLDGKVINNNPKITKTSSVE